ncbi:FAD binding domain-containing protein [Penicillium canariense]|uniref:FAD binding domain-containing protein n=1 Tax=Penicillium canariense TaxID=189055 RepID=A0A9W9IF17_9EURO|nr:FAD binding domain-containing protein [Penicillium canariense]KAJ5175237.1 FAD binding domain-containing protein [Penicillium canariense]
MSRSKPAPIGIVGGGLGGLTFARLLECAGIDYVVFERDASSVPEPGYQGGTLDIHGKTGQEALRRAGLHDQFEKLARRDATRMTVQSYKGESRTTFGEKRDAPEIDRLQLRQMLLDSLPGHRVRWGKALCTVERDEHQKQVSAPNIVLHFADGSTETGFRLVVGGDGAWSKVRQLITPAKPDYAGIMFIEGHLSLDNPQYLAAHEMVGAGNSIAMSANAILCIQQMSDRSYRVYMGIKGPQDLTRLGGELDVANVDETRAALLAPAGFFGDWAEHLRAFVSGAEGPWRVWPWCRLNPNVLIPAADCIAHGSNQSRNGWKRSSGVALIGDAAHPASPNGEGVNQAMYDAMLLFESIKGELGDKTDLEFNEKVDSEALERAISTYEAEMLPRGRDHIRDGMNVEKMFFGENAASTLIEKFNEMQHQGTKPPMKA